MSTPGQMCDDNKIITVGWCGAPCLLPPTSCSAKPERLMTLILALQGESEVVVAADSLAYESEPGGICSFETSKLRQIGNNWLFGFAGTEIGYTLCDQLKRENFQPSGQNIHEAAHEYANRMQELYQQRRYEGEMSALLVGVSNGQPGVYSWKTERDHQGRMGLSAANQKPHRAAIGAEQHGALYFANAFHSPKMDTQQRIRLAYFCVSEATKYDPRCGGRIEVAVVQESKVQLVADLDTVKQECAEIAESLRSRFNSPPQLESTSRRG